MVKTLSTALVLVFLLAARSHSQEVFSGEQKAKPKYPKAQPLASDHGKSDVHVEKAIPVQADKVAGITKANAPLKPSANVAVKPAASPSKAADASNKTASTTAAVQKGTSSPAVKTVSVQHSTSAKAAPKVEIAVAKEEETASASAEGPSQKLKNPAKTAVTKTSTPPSSTAHSSPAQVSKSPNVVSSKTEGVASKSSPKVEIAVAKPAGKADQKIEAKVSAPASAAAGNSKTSGAKNSVAEKGGSHPSSALVPASTPAKPTLADAPRKDQTPEIKAQSNVAALTAAGSHKEATLSASGKPLPNQNSMVETTITQPISNHFDTAFTKLADGFDFPVGKPDAQGYYKARGFRSRGHLGEDWDGVRGGDTDLGDPIYCIGDGLVVFARDCHMGWGNVLIVRHSYREGGTVKTVDSLYGHLLAMLVHRGQAVARGQKIATMGTAHGLYDAHLHLEIRKNLEIGMSRAAFAQDFSNYYDPTQFIQQHRHLQTGGGSYRVAMNTFTHDAHIKWDKARNYSHAHTGGGSSQSAAALKKALAAQH